MDHVIQAVGKSRKAILELALGDEKDANSASCAILKVLSIELIEMELMQANTLANLSTVMRDGRDEATVLDLAAGQTHLAQSSMDKLVGGRPVCQNRLIEAAVNLEAARFAKEISPAVTILDIEILRASARLGVKLKHQN
jgi:hypothetical protein